MSTGAYGTGRLGKGRLEFMETLTKTTFDIGSDALSAPLMLTTKLSLSLVLSPVLGNRCPQCWWGPRPAFSK